MTSGLERFTDLYDFAPVGYIPEYIETLRRLSPFKINVIYSGHDEPVDRNAEEIIRETLQTVRNIVAQR